MVHKVQVKRRLDESDMAAVFELLHVAAVADGHKPLNEHQWLDLVQGGRKGFAGFVAWEPGHTHPVGYAQLSAGPDSWAVEYVVDPHHRDGDSTIGADLVGAALEEVRRSGGGHVHMWVAKPGPAADEIARANGMKSGRELYQMRMLPASRLARAPTRHPAVPARGGRGGVAGGEQPGIRVPSRARRLGPRDLAPARSRTVVRPVGVPPSRAAGSPRSLLLDEDHMTTSNPPWERST